MYNIVIATMNSNEIDINEWVVHNILLGFEHILIKNDNLPDNLRKYILDSVIMK
jgi:hypothetical protein